MKDVPVDGFWSVIVYNKDGFFEAPVEQASFNSVTAKPEADGSVILRFGGDATQPNYMRIMDGWSYVVRLYRPRPEILSGAWKTPDLVAASNMLKGIDQRLSAEIVHVLMLMGHGDDLVICDVNHPAATIAAATTYGTADRHGGLRHPHGRAGDPVADAAGYLRPAPITRMEVVGDPTAFQPIFSRMQAVADEAEGPAGADAGPGTLRLLRGRQAVLRDHPHCRFRPLWLLHPEEGRGRPARVVGPAAQPASPSTDRM
jgi:L-fucose mutarotase